MKKTLILLIAALLLSFSAVSEESETVIAFDGGEITVNGEAITENPENSVYLAYRNETHEDVPEALKDLYNKVITITDEGKYRISGTIADAQIAVKAEDTDRVALILDGIDITCRTASAIIGYSAYDPRVPGEYGLTIVLEEGSMNKVTGSHTKKRSDDDVKFDGAIDSMVSLGFEGTGSLTVDADNEGIEVKFGHMTIHSGVFTIHACDDPLNVSEDGVGTLTVNGGYLYSAVKPVAGGEGDGIDSNGYIIFNGGTIINLAHPESMDSGIDSDMGSVINGGVIVGAGNMYDPIDEASDQLFMMLEFSEKTDDLIVVTDENNSPVFAYDFPYDYTYIAFSSPALTPGAYRVYLGGEIEGRESNGLYTEITSYIPGAELKHGGDKNADMSNDPFRGGMQDFENAGQGGFHWGKTPPDGNFQKAQEDIDGLAQIMEALDKIDLNELLKDRDLNELLNGKDLNSLLTGFSLTDLFTQEELSNLFPGIPASSLDLAAAWNGGGNGGMREFGGFGGMRGMQPSSDEASRLFMLTKESTGFTNISK
ncbi:MAG: carbohydrate-binding domain-containing protein [Clostridia bacterium]|nr:carbohydrate-binding domain-containing protein [Clostridia bacterium]